MDQEEIKEWHPQQEKILKDWAEMATCYRWMHDRAFRIYKKENMRFAIPVIILSTITGTANFAQDSFPEFLQEYVPMGIGALNLIAGLLTTISQFLRVNELQEGHRVATVSFAKFSRTITLELSLPKKDRDLSGKEFIDQCCQEMDRLIEQSPQIPNEILIKFKKKYGNVKTLEKPEIIQLKKVTIFKDEDIDQSIENIESPVSISNGCMAALRRTLASDSGELSPKIPLKMIETKKKYELEMENLSKIEQTRQSMEAAKLEAETKIEETEQLMQEKIASFKDMGQSKLEETEQLMQQKIASFKDIGQSKLEETEQLMQEKINSKLQESELLMQRFEELGQQKLEETEKLIQQKLIEADKKIQDKFAEAEKLIEDKISEADIMISEKLTDADKDIKYIQNLGNTSTSF